MALLGAYAKFKVKWDAEVTLPRLVVEKFKSTGSILDDFFRSSHISAYHDIPWCCLDGNDDYSFEYYTSERKLALIRLDICVQCDPNYGVIKSTVETDDCMFCKTNHEGEFEFFVFKNIKAYDEDWFEMLTNGDLNNAITRFLNT